MNRRAPKHLRAEGRKFWSGVAEAYSIDDPAGVALLTTAAECLDRIAAAREAIKKAGEIVTDRYGQVKVNPACLLEKDARNGFLAAVRALNLDIEPLRDGPGRPSGAAAWRKNGN